MGGFWWILGGFLSCFSTLGEFCWISVDFAWKRWILLEKGGFWENVLGKYFFWSPFFRIGGYIWTSQGVCGRFRTFSGKKVDDRKYFSILSGFWVDFGGFWVDFCRVSVH